MHDCHTTDQSAHPPSRLWLVSGNKSTSVEDRKRLWFGLNVNKHQLELLCIKPDLNLSHTKSKHDLKKYFNAVAPVGGCHTRRSDIMTHRHASLSMVLQLAKQLIGLIIR